MSYDDVYEKVLPYLSDPKKVKEFLDKHRESSVDELVGKINQLMTESDTSLKTDFRILLNALSKHG